MSDVVLGPAAEQLLQRVLAQRNQAYAASQEAEASYQAVLKALAEARGVGVVELEVVYRLAPPLAQVQRTSVEAVNDANS